jgi:hypothetical protein
VQAQEGAQAAVRSAGGRDLDCWFLRPESIRRAHRRGDCGPSDVHIDTRQPSDRTGRCTVFKPSGIAEGKIPTRGVAIGISAFAISWIP